jgi:hypothetical protein
MKCKYFLILIPIWIGAGYILRAYFDTRSDFLELKRSVELISTQKIDSTGKAEPSTNAPPDPAPAGKFMDSNIELERPYIEKIREYTQSVSCRGVSIHLDIYKELIDRYSKEVAALQKTYQNTKWINEFASKVNDAEKSIHSLQKTFSNIYSAHVLVSFFVCNKIGLFDLLSSNSHTKTYSSSEIQVISKEFLSVLENEVGPDVASQCGNLFAQASKAVVNNEGNPAVPSFIIMNFPKYVDTLIKDNDKAYSRQSKELVRHVSSLVDLVKVGIAEFGDLEKSENTAPSARQHIKAIINLCSEFLRNIDGMCKSLREDSEKILKFIDNVTKAFTEMGAISMNTEVYDHGDPLAQDVPKNATEKPNAHKPTPEGSKT